MTALPPKMSCPLTMMAVTALNICCQSSQQLDIEHAGAQAARRQLRSRELQRKGGKVKGMVKYP